MPDSADCIGLLHDVSYKAVYHEPQAAYKLPSGWIHRSPFQL